LNTLGRAWHGHSSTVPGDLTAPGWAPWQSPPDAGIAIAVLRAGKGQASATPDEGLPEPSTACARGCHS